MLRVVSLMMLIIVSNPILAEVKSKVKVKPQPTELKRSCVFDFVATLGSSMVFTEGSMAILAANEPNAEQKKKFRSKPYSFYIVDLKSGKSKNSQTLLLPSRPLLLDFDSKGFTTIKFKGKQAGCKRGKGTLHRYAFTRSKPIQEKEGRFAILPSNEGRRLIDLNENSILNFDAKLSSWKSVQNFQPGNLPLYWDSNSKNTIVWKADDDTNRFLRIFPKTGNKFIQSTRFEDGYRVAAHGNQIAALGLDMKTNLMKLRLLSSWSQVKVDIEHPVHLPRFFSVGEASAFLNLSAKKLILFGASPPIQSKWRRIFISDYEKDRIVSTYTAPKGTLLGSIELSQDGKHLGIELLKGGYTSGVAVFDFKTSKWQSYPTK